MTYLQELHRAKDQANNRSNRIRDVLIPVHKVMAAPAVGSNHTQPSYLGAIPRGVSTIRLPVNFIVFFDGLENVTVWSVDNRP